MSRRGGIIQIQANGVIYDAKGTFTHNLGRPKREPIVGADGIHGDKETPQPATLKGKFTDRAGLDVNAIVTMRGATITMGLANGKTFVLRDAVYSGSGDVTSDEGEIDVEFFGDGEEVPA
jgi:hypothetical protein